MWHTLASIYAILNSDVESGGIEDALDGQEEVLDFGRREVVQAGNNAAGGDENVAWQEGLEVYEGVGEGCDVKDLAGSVYSMWCLSLSAVQQQRAYLGRDHKGPKLDHGILC
jgi:hypothetical protein